MVVQEATAVVLEATAVVLEGQVEIILAMLHLLSPLIQMFHQKTFHQNANNQMPPNNMTTPGYQPENESSNEKQAPPLPSKNPADVKSQPDVHVSPPPYSVPSQPTDLPVLPDLPSVPPNFLGRSNDDDDNNNNNSSGGGGGGGDVDFDDLSRRFENLRKKV